MAYPHGVVVRDESRVLVTAASLHEAYVRELLSPSVYVVPELDEKLFRIEPAVFEEKAHGDIFLFIEHTQNVFYQYVAGHQPVSAFCDTHVVVLDTDVEPSHPLVVLFGYGQPLTPAHPAERAQPPLAGEVT